MKKPEYKQIPGFPDYKVGDDGTVWSVRKSRCEWRRLKQSTMCGIRSGGHTLRPPYKVVYLQGGVGIEHRHGFLVHKLVLLGFVGPCPEGMECRHLNGKHDDNRLANLAWGTPRENIEDKIRHGKTGTLSSAIVTEARRRAWTESIRHIAKCLAVPYWRLRAAVIGRTYRHVAQQPVAGNLHARRKACS